MIPKLRPSVFVSHDGDEFHFFFTNTRVKKRYKLNRSAQTLLRFLDGRHTAEEIAERLGRETGRDEEREVRGALAFLHRERIIEDVDRTPPEGWFTDLEIERYDRQLNFLSDFATPDVDKFHLQKRLKDHAVALIGLGGAGTWAAYGLLMAGIGKLVAVDFDRVERSNLSRQALYTEGDIGREKLEAFRERARALNSGVEVETVCLRVEEDTDLAPVLRGCDLVVSLSDIPSAEAVSGWVGRACVGLGLPHIVGGGYSLHVGLVGSTVLPGRSGCWECWMEHVRRLKTGSRWFSTLDFLGDHESVTTGNLGVCSAVIGNLHALEAIKVASGFTEPLMCNARAELDFLTLNVHWDRFARVPECPVCAD